MHKYAGRVVAFVALFSIGLLWLTSCKPDADPCLQPITVSMRIGTYQVNDSSLIISDSLLPNPAFIAQTDSGNLVFFGAAATSSFALPLSSRTDSASYIIYPDTADNSKHDQLTFYYDRTLQFISNSCGYTYFYNLKGVTTTHNFIDSVVIANPVVNNNASTPQHVKIYY